MRLTEATTAADLRDVEGFFGSLGLAFPEDNRRQFVAPRADGAHRVSSRLLRVDGRVRGILSHLEAPLRSAAGNRLRARWPMNFFLAPELRGRGLGQSLMREVMREADMGVVLGGNECSTPVLERTGWRRLGTLETFTWRRPPRPERVERAIDRLEVRAGLPPSAPWTDVLRSCFAGALSPFHGVFQVESTGRPVGYFVLSARRVEAGARVDVTVTDFDSVAGREEATLSAALVAAFASGASTGPSTASSTAPSTTATVHACTGRFVRALRALEPDETREGLPLWIVTSRSLPDLAECHVTHGDHDRYRRWPDSLRFVRDLDRDDCSIRWEDA